MQLQQEKQTAKLNLLRKCGLLALNLASIFEKLLEQKTFYLPAARDWKPNLKNNLLRKCGLLAHTSAAFLKNCCTEKLLFACGSRLETLLLEKPLESGSARLGHIPSLPWESQLPLKPCFVIASFLL